MKSIQLLCAAKVNLSLDVTGKREDGYHTLASVFQSVGVYDALCVSVGEGRGICLCCNVPYIPCNGRNLAYRAAWTFLKTAGINCRVEIQLQKNIPSGAGMGGGSADAAGVLYALNLLLDCGFSEERLREIGLMLGADVPFMLMGGTALAEGIGEILTPLRPLPAIPMVIVKGTQSISTADAYEAMDQGITFSRPDTRKMLHAVETQDISRIARCCCNVFESVTNCEEVHRARKALREYGALQAVMTGSGSAVFGIFENRVTAQEAARSLRGRFPFSDACMTVQKPFEII